MRSSSSCLGVLEHFKFDGIVIAFFVSQGVKKKAMYNCYEKFVLRLRVDLAVTREVFFKEFRFKYPAKNHGFKEVKGVIRGIKLLKDAKVGRRAAAILHVSEECMCLLLVCPPLVVYVNISS